MAKKKSAKSRTPNKPRPWQKLSGMTFCFAGRWSKWDKQGQVRAIEAAGGTVVDKVTAELNYLIVHSKNAGSTSAAEKEAVKLNAGGGASIQVINEQALEQLAAPTRDEALAILSSGPEGVKIWNGLPLPHGFDLSGADLAGADLTGAHLNTAILDGSNLKGANLSRASLGDGRNLCLDGAILKGAHVGTLEHCSARRADATGTILSELNDCSFDEAVLVHTHLYAVRQTSMKKADCRKIELYNYGRKTPVQVDFTGADLTGARLSDLDLSGCCFRGANLAQADLRNARLHNVDLTKADLRGAQLRAADLKNATVDGANFEGAVLVDAKLDGVDCSKARGLDPSKTTTPPFGPALQKLEKLAKKAAVITIKAEVALDDGYVEIETGGNSKYNHYEWRKHIPGADVDSDYNHSWRSRSYAEALSEVVRRWQEGTLRLDSVKVSSTKSPIKGRQLKDLVTAAVCEAFGVEMPSQEDLKREAKQRQSSGKQAREELLQELLGKGGVKKFNARTPAEIAKAGSFAKTDFAGARLSGVKFPKLDLQSANFEGAILSKAKFQQCKCHQAGFKKANLEGADLSTSGFNGADFTQANLGKANLIDASLRKALCRETNLAGANLSRADLTGTDLSTADLEGAKLSGATFDQTTQFPQGYKLPEDMNWRGKGANPALLQAPKLQVGSLSTEDFMARLAESVEAERLKKALKMLKAERFQLYAQVTGQGLVGVVKSQTDPDLVYSCQLNRDGAFACCTQNLNICGGLRGALCKHLLVLIVGLANGGQIDAAEVDNWIVASKAHKPQLDKDVMSETFLRYKGAEAGQIDWRPTETAPEDFYAF